MRSLLYFQLTVAVRRIFVLASVELKGVVWILRLARTGIPAGRAWHLQP